MLTNPSPVYLFGFLLQESLPKNIQLLDYLVDNSAFKLNANSSDLVSANKFISLLLENKLIDKESIKNLKKVFYEHIEKGVCIIMANHQEELDESVKIHLENNV